MTHSPNYIHFQNKWQVVCLESPDKHMNREQFHELFNILNSREYQCDYDDFSYNPNHCEFGKLRNIDRQGGQGYGKLIYLNGFLALIEEWAEINIDQFIEKSKNVLKCWFRCFPATIVITQQCIIRALVHPVHFSDSREFLGDKVMKVGPHLKKSFSDMPFKIGFNTAVIRDDTEHNLQVFIDAAINSWRDNKSVWIEIQGNVAFPHPLNATNPEISMFPIHICKEFIVNDIVNFLKEYDLKQDEKV
jgi:hypothetical protein